MKFEPKIMAMRLKRLRSQRNMTQEHLAELIDVSPVYISYMEKGTRIPALEKMIAICNTLGCTLDELLDGFLTAKPSGSPLSIDKLIADCTNEEKEFLMKTLVAFKEYIDDSI